jgi:hypothetical protein
MLLRELQVLLRQIYGLEIDVDVADYLVTDPRQLKYLLGEGAETVEETLLLVEDDESLEVALYLDETMLARLTESKPCSALSEHNLDDFCKVLEGVSHFLYVAWNAGRDKQFTRLELEIQAEIDKYVSSRLILEAQQSGGSSLLTSLFENVRFSQHLSPESLERYRQANDVAGRYCHSLQQRFPEAGPDMAMLQELRAFYRMPQPDKLSHINALQFA